jgi:hypothetical protein
VTSNNALERSCAHRGRAVLAMDYARRGGMGAVPGRSTQSLAITLDAARLVEMATKFRKALEAVPRDKRPITLESFPRGACGDASLLLGALFVDCGITGFNYVCGERGDIADNSWTSHAWLQSEDWIVDVTADQFADAPAGVIVAKGSPWHAGFNIESTSPADFRLWHGPSIMSLHRIYARIKPSVVECDG